MDIEELDYRETGIGALVLRRRREPLLGDRIVTEVKLGDEFLMSSLFTAGEIALADLGIDAAGRGDLDVVVGGLGLGYTARAALDRPEVRSLVVVEALDAVIDWHRRGLTELGTGIVGDPRCHLVEGDFFALVDDGGPGFDDREPGRRFDAILVDIDHSPRHALVDAPRAFYHPLGLRHLLAHLRDGGVFALWSNDPPDDAFLDALRLVFARADASVVEFENPYSGGLASSTVYVASR